MISTDKRHFCPSALEGSWTEKKANRPLPKVIEFVEPGKQLKKKKSLPPFLQAQVLISLQGKRKQIEIKSKSTREDLDEFEFKSIAREVREFGVTGLSRKDRKKYEDWKAQSLGGKAPKGQKMPYPMLMRQIKRRKEREQEQREREHAMGIFKKKPDKKSSASTRAPMGWWVDNSSKGLQASVGKFKAGVQRLSKADLHKITSKKKR
ncbi:hypothetical protein pdam_00017976 [Pocillopora damicornis]|uniref:Uncharacterized protein n=1 Tax=Pocillopora damicornis TaxID=46731 RepID=A0A3M6UY87_POCDA|nr:hypothetical protein pdam_00017976 [Pocillopora damicornis]